ncbi:MAG: sigE 10 [Phycisphaerales bacterium]|nr:sigE 10 [Phycisphaerales bacterium]
MNKTTPLAAAFLVSAACFNALVHAEDAPVAKPTSPATQPAAPDVAALIRQLGDDDFHARQEAGRKLREMGKAAFPALKEAQNSEDPEIRTRAKELIERQETPPQAGPVPQALAGNNWNQSVSIAVDNGSRTVDVRQTGRTIHIEEDGEGVRMTVNGQIDGRPAIREYKAKDADELKRQNPAAYALYQQFAQVGINGINQINAGRLFIHGNIGLGLPRQRAVQPQLVLPRHVGPGGDDLNRLEDQLLEQMKGAKLPDGQQDQVKGLLKELREVLPPSDPAGDGVDAQMREYNRRSDVLRKQLQDLKLPDPGDALPPPASGRLGIAAQEEVVEGQGLVITHILPDSRAEKIGIKENDVIQKVNGKAVHSTHDLRKIVTENPKGLVVEGLREGKPLKLEEKEK